ncbi:MAG: HD domain-containing phosphohydrolase [Gammaproteobacteria bacterium]
MTEHIDTSSKRSMLLAWGGLLVFLIAGFVAVTVVAERNFQQSLLSWQDRLGLVLDSRNESIDRWLTRQVSTVNDLASNGSLQLYLALLSSGDGLEQGEDSAELVYLKDMLVLAAHRGGFAVDQSTRVINANVDATPLAGMALIDANGRIQVATPDMPVLGPEARAAIEEARTLRRPVQIDIHKNIVGTPSMGFVVPVTAIQDPEAIVGVVVGIKPIAGELYPLLRQRGLTTRTHEIYLVRARDRIIEYISPLSDDTPPLTRQLGMDTPGLAAAFAIANTGRFTRGVDYLGRKVLVSSRAVDRTDWVLVHTITAEEALADAQQRRRDLYAGLVLVLLVLSVSLVAAWRHGSSVRHRMSADALRTTNEEIEAQRALLKSVTENTNDFILILDAEGGIVFANAATGRQCGTVPLELVGKPMATVFGRHVAAQLEGAADHAASAHHEQTLTTSICTKDERTFAVSASPIPDGRTLMVLRDVTDLLAAEERSQRTMWQLVQTLAGVLDSHDPHSSNHSRKVVAVANAIGEELHLSEQDMDSLRIAANLMNIGKITIPAEILSKETKLSDEEFALIRNAIPNAAKMLSGVEFDGPVVEAIAQSTELLNGKGYPLGLSGDQIIIHARILAIANAFVAMTHPRSFRRAMDPDKASGILMQETDEKYDRRVVAALIVALGGETGARWREEWMGAEHTRDAD